MTEVSEARDDSGRHRRAEAGSRKPPVNQGPPANTVFDADMAARLRQMLDTDTGSE